MTEQFQIYIPENFVSGAYMNDYTLTMDILVDSLPQENLSIYQTGGMNSFAWVDDINFICCR